MTDFEKISRGERASSILAMDVFKDVLAEAREEAIKGLLEDTTEKRADYIATIRAIEILRQRLESIVTTGKNAQKRQD